MSEKPSKSLDLENGPTKYVDRVTNDGKHGDAGDEPTERQPAPATPGSAAPDKKVSG